MALLKHSRSGADVFFASTITAALAAALLWATVIATLPDFVQGLAAGIIVASAAFMFLHHGRDEYTRTIWNAGTSAGFSVVIVWLSAMALARGIPVLREGPGQVLISDARLLALMAVTAFLCAIGIRKLVDLK